MSELFHFEFRRLFRRVSLYVCTGIAFLPALFMMLITLLATLDGGSGMTPEEFIQYIFIIGNLPTFVIVFTSIFVCEDYTRGTAKTIYSLGYPRWQHFTAKFAASNVAAVIMFGFILCVSLIFTLFIPNKRDSMDIIGSLFYRSAPMYLIILQQLSAVLAIHAFIFMFAELVNKTGIAIIIGIFAPGLVSGAVTFVCSILNTLSGSDSSLMSEDKSIFSHIMYFFNTYWISSGSSASIMSMLSGYGFEYNYVLAICINLGYVLLFGGLALVNVSKKEIK